MMGSPANAHRLEAGRWVLRGLRKGVGLPGAGGRGRGPGGCREGKGAGSSTQGAPRARRQDPRGPGSHPQCGHHGVASSCPVPQGGMEGHGGSARRAPESVTECLAGGRAGVARRGQRPAVQAPGVSSRPRPQPTCPAEHRGLPSLPSPHRPAPSRQAPGTAVGLPALGSLREPPPVTAHTHTHGLWGPGTTPSDSTRTC